MALPPSEYAPRPASHPLLTSCQPLALLPTSFYLIILLSLHTSRIDMVDEGDFEDHRGGKDTLKIELLYFFSPAIFKCSNKNLNKIFRFIINIQM